MFIDIIPKKDAVRLISKRNKGYNLTATETMYLEYWLFINQPTKQCYALVDKLYEYCYIDVEGSLPIIVGKCDTFNLPRDQCIMHVYENNLMYKGMIAPLGAEAPIDKHYHSEDFFAYYFTIDKVCEKRIKEFW